MKLSKLEVSEWEMAAAQLGLTATVESQGKRLPSLRGSIRGFDVTIRMEVQKGGETEQKYVVVAVEFEPLGFDLRVRPKGLFGAIRTKRCELGDDWLDKHVIVKSSQPLQVAAHFTSRSRVEALKTLYSRFPKAVVTDRTVEWTTGSDIGDVVVFVPQLVAVVDQLAS